MSKSKHLLALFLVIVIGIVAFSPVYGEETEKVNINTATVEELAKLERIGPQYAIRIVEYRDANGPFETPQDIMKVKGIGEKTFELNKQKIAVK